METTRGEVPGEPVSEKVTKEQPRFEDLEPARISLEIKLAELSKRILILEALLVHWQAFPFELQTFAKHNRSTPESIKDIFGNILAEALQKKENLQEMMVRIKIELAKLNASELDATTSI